MPYEQMLFVMSRTVPWMIENRKMIWECIVCEWLTLNFNYMHPPSAVSVVLYNHTFILKTCKLNEYVPWDTVVIITT